MRRGVVLSLTLLTFAPTAVGLAVLRPAAAVATTYSNYGITAIGGGVQTAGDIGITGGLVTLDAGTAYINARLDSSPSSNVRAAPIEPGTLARTLIGTVNTAAGSSVLSVPDS